MRKYKTSTKNFLSSCLIMLLLLSISANLFACRENNPPQETDGLQSVTEGATEPPPADIVINAENSAEYTIVRYERAGTRLTDSINLFVRKFSNKGFEFGYTEDWVADTSTIPEDAKEILIGTTNRVESAEAYAKLKSEDYSISVEGSRIIIVGGSDAATIKALDYFTSNYVDRSSLEITVSSVLYDLVKAEYAVSSITINGTDISSYSIVVPRAAGKITRYAATLLSDTIKDRTGITVKVITENNCSGKNEIHIGKTSLNPSEPEGYNYSYSQDTAAGVLGISGTNHTIVYAVRQLILEIDKTENGEVCALSADTGTVKTMEKTVVPTESTLEGKIPVALSDQKNACAVVIDLAADVTSESAILWQWSPSSANGFAGNGYANSIDEVKLRYSEVLGKYVVCITSSAGFLGVAEYPSGNRIWEASASSFGPHSMEYLPNGNVACALSGNTDYSKGCIRIYTATESATSVNYVSASLSGAHGVLWDDELGILWALGNDGVVAYEIGGTAKEPTITLIDGLGGTLPKGGGHDLSACHGDVTQLWVSADKIYKFNKYTGAFTDEYEGSGIISASSVKSISNTHGGIIIRTVATNVYKGHDTDTLTIFVRNASGEYEKIDYVFSNRAFYKARSFDASLN